MRIALVVMMVGMCGCLARMPEQEELPVVDAGPGAPPYVCGTTTCKGCCDRNRCKVGNREDACGSGGLACGVCGTDALCGAENRCEALDPNRYGSDGGSVGGGGKNGTELERNRTCGFYGGSWICW